MRHCRIRVYLRISLTSLLLQASNVTKQLTQARMTCVFCIPSVLSSCFWICWWIVHNNWQILMILRPSPSGLTHQLFLAEDAGAKNPKALAKDFRLEFPVVSLGKKVRGGSINSTTFAVVCGCASTLVCTKNYILFGQQSSVSYCEASSLWSCLLVMRVSTWLLYAFLLTERHCAES